MFETGNAPFLKRTARKMMTKAPIHLVSTTGCITSKQEVIPR
jgi:hypothetical protein